MKTTELEGAVKRAARTNSLESILTSEDSLHLPAEIDKAAKHWPSNDGSFDLPSEVGVFCGFLGTIGIATGPTTHLIDSCALTDRFLAERMSAPTEPFAWKPGHFHREIPEGYTEAIASGDPTRLTDMADRFELTRLWEQIR